jgi:hypothetical protein
MRFSAALADVQMQAIVEKGELLPDDITIQVSFCALQMLADDSGTDVVLVTTNGGSVPGTPDFLPLFCFVHAESSASWRRLLGRT